MSPSSTLFQTVQASVVTAGRAVGKFFTAAYAAVVDFFVSGRALQLLQSAVQAVRSFAVRVFSPLASLMIPLLQRLAPGVAFLPETVALWIFGTVIVLIVLLLILLGQSRRRSRRLPRVKRQAAQAPENKIEFDVVEPGPAPSSVEAPENAVTQPIPAPSEQPQAEQSPAEQPSENHAGSAAIPEISLEPLGYYKPSEERGTAENAPAAESNTQPAAITPPAAPAGLPDDVFLASAEDETPQTPAQETEEPAPAPVEAPALHPLEEITKPAAGPTEEENPAGPGIPQLTQEKPTTEPVVPEDKAPAASMQEEPPAGENETPAAAEEQTETPTAPEEKKETAPAALLSQLLEEESALQNLRQADAPPAAPTAAPEQPVPAVAPAAASVFAGDADLDLLLHDGVVADATAVEQLFQSSYRSSIPKLAISAKNLQDIPEEMRRNLKLTVVALSPIELSIARDLAMRLEAPAFVGEAILVAKKMGYETYLTTYANITRNYKEVHIVETSGLRPPPAESGSTPGLISLN